MKATVVIRSAVDRERICRWARNVEAGTTVEFRKARRSDEQNRLLWARLGDISEQVEWYGQNLSAEDWKTVLTASLRKSRVVPGVEPGSIVVLGLSTSKMTKEEFSMLLDLIDAFAAERGVSWTGEAANAA